MIFARYRLHCLPAAIVAAASIALPVCAQNYPNRPIRFVVPFSPGGAADVPGRILTQKLTDALGHQVVVDNRPGAGSTIGADQVAKAPPDGYTLLTISNTHFVSAALYKKLPYDSVADFAPVTQVTSAPNVIVVHPSLPAKTVRELIALAKAKPGKIDYASSGNGSTQHLTGALFTKMAGIEMTHIPYRGSGPATADLLSGQVTVGFPGIAGMIFSGWRIYNASPIFPFKFPVDLTLGGWLGGALQWHFAAMWVLALNGLAYLLYGLFAGHFKANFLPLPPRAVFNEFKNALRGRISHVIFC